MARPKVAVEKAGASPCSCTSLRKATRRISQLYDAGLAPCGLKTTQLAILAQINRAQAITVGALADALVMDSGALAHTLKPLERDGFVAVKVDPKDRRKRLIVLKASGRKKLAAAHALWERTQAAFEDAMGRGKSDTLRAAMAHLASEEFGTAFAARLAALRRR